MNRGFQPHERRFMMRLPLPVCCLSNESVKRFNQAKFSRLGVSNT